MAQVRAYLGFTDDCQQAMEFYQGCFGGELTVQTVGESPTAAHMPPEMHGRVMHSSLVNGDLVLMASGMNSDVRRGNSVTLMVECTSAEEIERIFERLAEGGRVTQPLEETFWGATFGHLTDRYGIPWMLNHAH